MHPMNTADTLHMRLPGGVHVVLQPLPQATTSTVAVFINSGSAHEGARLNGISHFVEHMLFKGTATRDARRINLDAERLGAEVNAHTDKDHTALHMRGLPEHAPQFVHMLAELVLQPQFPADELERERQVLLQEHAEDGDDPVAAAFRLFDRACFGSHPAALPVIGPRRHIESFSRAELQAWVGRQFTAPNLVLGVAGRFDAAGAQALLRAAEDAFVAAPAGSLHSVPPVVYEGGLATLRHGGSSQAHLVLGFPMPALAQDSPALRVAAAVFGEGMSSPLLHTLREQQGLAYHAACSADVLTVCGQFVVEASTSPAQFDALLDSVLRLLQAQAEGVDAVDLERAHNQLAVRWLRAQERPLQRLEAAALDLFTHGRLQPPAQRLQALREVSAGQVRAGFEQMLAAGAAVAVTGEVPRGTRARLKTLLGDVGGQTAASSVRPA